MFNIVSHFFLFLLLIYFNGKVFIGLFKNSRLNLNHFEISVFGLIITSLIAQSLNFFFPLNNNILFLNFFLTLILIYFYQIKIPKIKFQKIENVYYLFLILVIISIYGSGFSDDLNHYHYSYINNTDNTNYIIGLSHMHWAFGNSSNWLIAHSYFNFDNSKLQDIHVLNGLIFFIVLGGLYYDFKKNIQSKKVVSLLTPILLFIIIFTLLKYTRLKEFGIDRPGFLLFYFLIVFYIKNFFFNVKSKITDDKIILLTYISIFLFFIKITFFFVGLIPIYYIFKYKRFKILYSYGFIAIYFFIISYLIKNILISGCLIYPVPFTCFEFLSWSTKEIAEKWYFLNEVLNKSWYRYEGELKQHEYINNFNWLETWLKTTKIELIEFFITTFVSLLVAFISFKKNIKKNNISFIKVHNEILMVFASIFVLSLIIFIYKIPVIRMSHYLFILLSIIIIFIFYKKFQLNVNYKTLTFFLILCITFNIGKNFARISKNDFINDPYLMINSKVYDQNQKSLGSFNYYLGWYGKAPAGREELNNLNYSKILIFHSIHK